MFIFGLSSSSAAVMVVITASNVALPCCCLHHWCVCRVGCGQSMTVVDGGGCRPGGEAAEWVGALWRMVVVEEQEGLRVV